MIIVGMMMVTLRVTNPTENSSVESRQLSLLVHVYVDLHELFGLMIGRIRYINEKIKLSCVTVVS